MDFQNFLEQRLNLASSTTKKYVKRVQRFEDELGELEACSPREVYEQLERISKSGSDHNIWVAALKKYQDYLDFVDKAHQDFTELLSSKSYSKRLPKPISLDKINEFCEQIPKDNLRDRAIVEVLYCGLRNSELCSLNVDDVADRTLNVIGKGDKQRIVPVNDVAWRYLLDHIIKSLGTNSTYENIEKYGKEYAFGKLKESLGGPTPVFKTHGDNRITPRILRKIISRYAKDVDPSIHPHRFRHSFATHTLDEGLGNLIALKDVLGHSKLETTTKYVLTSKTSRDLVKGFHPRQRYDDS